MNTHLKKSKRERYFKNLNYKIVCVGNNCFPRVVSTLARRKPTKEQGELTCPFDLAFHFDVKENMKLIQSNFEYFFDGLTWGVWSDMETWTNPDLNSFYTHDHSSNKEEFVARYKKRIENFYTYANSKENVFFLLDTFSQEGEKTILDFFEILLNLKNRNVKNTFLVVFNHAERPLKLESQNILVVNSPNSMDNLICWTGFFKNRTDPQFNAFQDSMSGPLKKFIREKTNGK